MYLNVKKIIIAKKKMDCLLEYVDGYYFEEKLKLANIIACHSFNVGRLFKSKKQMTNLHLEEKDYLQTSQVEAQSQDEKKPIKVKTKMTFLEDYGSWPNKRLQRARQRNLTLCIRRYEKKASQLYEAKIAKKKRGKRIERIRKMGEKNKVGRKSVARS